MMTSRPELIPVTLASALAFGMILRLLSSIRIPLAERLGIEEGRMGRLLSVFHLAVVPWMLVSGSLADHLGIQEVLIVGSLLAALGLFALTWSRGPRGVLYGILLLAIAEACLSAAAVVLMPKALIESNESAAANLGYVFFGLGALLTPALAEVLLDTIGFRWTLYLAAIGSLVPALILLWTPGAAFGSEAVPATLWTVLGNPVFWMVTLAFLFYCPLEGSLGLWGINYLTEVGHRESRARVLVASFWLSFLASRLGMAFVLQQEILSRHSDPWVICILALLAMVVLGNLAGAQNRRTASVGLFLVGICLGPIVPMLVGLLFKEFPNTRGTAYGAMFAFGAGGSLFLPPLFGLVVRRRTVRATLLAPTIVALLLAGTALVLALG